LKAVTLPMEVVRTRLPTALGDFAVHGFESSDGFVYLALIKGEIGDGRSVLCRIHSECLTGDVLGSLRCDCGPQLRMALNRIAAEGRGILVYAIGHEGRGIGLLNKLLAYKLQDGGLDTVDANLELHLPVDIRDFEDSARVLASCGVRSARLLTNNPNKAAALQAVGVGVEAVVPMTIAPHTRNRAYLQTKQERLGHLHPASSDRLHPLTNGAASAPDITDLIGEVHNHPDRPYVVLKFAQTLDGRLATMSGDSKWISGPQERLISHSLRAACDGVLVGLGTVEADDPRLSVRLVPGASPLRAVLDSRLRLSRDRKVLNDEAPTLIFTGTQNDPAYRKDLENKGISIREVRSAPDGLDLSECLRELREFGVETLLVEGGARVITSFLKAGLADRVIVGIAPMVIGLGKESVGDLRIHRISEALQLENESVYLTGRDVIVAGDLLRV
jgi:GTP cyclohydrolase II